MDSKPQVEINSKEKKKRKKISSRSDLRRTKFMILRKGRGKKKTMVIRGTRFQQSQFQKINIFLRKETKPREDRNSGNLANSLRELFYIICSISQWTGRIEEGITRI